MAETQEPVAVLNENGLQYDVDFGDNVVTVSVEDASNEKEAVAQAKKVYQTAPKAEQEGNENE